MRAQIDEPSCGFRSVAGCAVRKMKMNKKIIILDKDTNIVC
jgi:hypothetical protein